MAASEDQPVPTTPRIYGGGRFEVAVRSIVSPMSVGRGAIQGTYLGIATVGTAHLLLPPTTRLGRAS